MTVTRSSISDLNNLQSALKGTVIAPEDPAYEHARTVFLGSIDMRPGVIVRPVDPADVAATLAFARSNGIELAVRSGGHSGAGHSTTDGGMVLDVRDMKRLEIDVDSRTAWAEAGVTAAEYSKAVGALGFATGFGDAGTVGISGITLGGGVGYLTRKHGLTIDSLLAADVVTADGEHLRTDATSHPDLFWAIRGGGGNFGVATRFKFRLHPVEQIVGGMILLPATADTIAGAVAAAEQAPEELSAILNVMPAPPMPFVPQEHHGKLSIMGLMCYAGDAAAGARALAPFRALATPMVNMLRPMPYADLFPPEDPSYRPKAESRMLFLNGVDRSVAKTIVDALGRNDAPMRVVQLRVLGGAMARVPAEATAFAHRSSRIMAAVVSFFDGPQDRPRRAAWTDEVSRALDQGDRGAYVNFLGDEGEGRVRAAYPGATWERLRQVKARYDPTNLFRRNQNVPPR